MKGFQIKIKGWRETCFVNHDGGVVTLCTAPLSKRVVDRRLDEVSGLLRQLGWKHYSTGEYISFFVRGKVKPPTEKIDFLDRVTI